MSSREIIRQFIVAEIGKRNLGGSTAVSDSESLLFSKKTDSLFFIDLILFLENKFSLSLSSTTLGKEDLDSIDRIVKFVEAKARQ